MYLYFVIMNGVARSEEVVTEPVLRVSCCMSILCITLTKDTMFENAQVFYTSIYRIGLSSVCKCPPPIDSRQSWDRQWLLWKADCCSGWHFKSYYQANNDSPGSLKDFARYQSHSIHRTKQVEWLFVLLIRGILECPGHWWNLLYVWARSRYTHNSKPL